MTDLVLELVLEVVRIPLGMLGAAVAPLWAARWLLLGLATLSAALGCLAAAWWRRRGEDALSRRKTFDLVPAKSFNPSDELVRRRGAQLSRVPGATGPLPARASAVRLRFFADAGRLAHQVQGPEKAASVLKQLPYRDVAVIDTARAARRRRHHITFPGAAPVPRNDDEGVQA